MIPARCSRCGMPRSELLRLTHETSFWHRKYRHIQRQLALGKNICQIAAAMHCSRNLLYKCQKMASEAAAIHEEGK